MSSSSTPPLPDSCRAAVFDPGDRSLRIRRFALPPPASGQVVVKIDSSAICGSDLHTFLGHRTPPKPLILGHESCGRIVHLDESAPHDAAGMPLAPGDRVTWSLAANCGHCFPCEHSLPQKCDALFKYGHESVDAAPELNGGFAEYIYLVPGTALYRIPDTLPDRNVVFANCAAATMAAAHRIAGTRPGESVLVQGAGLLGLCAAAMAAAAGARSVLVTDTNPARLETALAFGATHTFQVQDDRPESFHQAAREIAGPRGFDVAIEVCGHPPAVPGALPALRTGARYILAGCVFPGAEASLNLHTITTRLLRLTGLHNYAPEDLLTAVRFLDAHRDTFPFDGIVAREFPLEEIFQAFQYALDHRDSLRIAIAP